MASAAGLNSRILPSSSIVMMASSDDFRMAALRASPPRSARSSARRRVSSRKTRTVPRTSPSSPRIFEARPSIGTVDPSRATRAPEAFPAARLVGFLADPPPDFVQGPAQGLGGRPSGQGLGHGVHRGDPPEGVGGDHGIPDAQERDLQPGPELVLGLQEPAGLLGGGLDPPTRPPGLPPHQGDGQADDPEGRRADPGLHPPDQQGPAGRQDQQGYRDPTGRQDQDRRPEAPPPRRERQRDEGEDEGETVAEDRPQGQPQADCQDGGQQGESITRGGRLRHSGHGAVVVPE